MLSNLKFYMKMENGIKNTHLSNEKSEAYTQSDNPISAILGYETEVIPSSETNFSISSPKTQSTIVFPDKSTNRDIQLFDLAPIAYLIVDENQNIIEANKALKLFVGIEDDLYNKSLKSYIHFEDYGSFNLQWIKLLDSKKQQQSEVRWINSNGQRLFVKLDFNLNWNIDALEILIALTDITIQKQIEDTQSFLLGYSWTKTAQDFFESLAEYLYTSLGADYVCIDRLIPGGLEAQTVAVYFDGKFEDNVRYALEDTPCGKVSGQEVCCFPSKVRNLFPNDEVLQEMVAESYAGITLWGSNGTAIGLIAVISREALADTKLTEIVLKQVSIRAASELEHRHNEKVIRMSEERFSKAFYHSPMGINIFRLSDGVSVNSNNAYLSLIGYSKKEIDISKRKKAEISLQESELKFRSVLDHSKDAIYRVNLQSGLYEYISPSLENLFGYTIDDMNTYQIEGAFKLVYPEDLPLTVAGIAKLEKTGSVILEYRLRSKNGDYRWISNTMSLIKDENGKPLYRDGIFRDITEGKKAEDSILQAKEEWERTFNSIPDLIAIIDPNNKILRANKAMADRIGLTENQCPGIECFKAIHNMDHAPAFCPHSKTVNDGHMHEVEIFEQQLNGDFIVTTTPLMNKSGEMIGSVHVARDISDRKKAEDLLRQSEERYRALFERSLSIMMLIDPDTAEIRNVNQAACDYYGWEQDEFLTKYISDINLITREEAIRNMQNAKNELQNHFFFKHRLANGEIRDVEVYSCPLEFNGEISLFAIIHDITESKKLEEALCESEYFFRESQRAGFIGSYKTDFVNNSWESSEVLNQIFGIEKKYFKDFNSFLDIIHPDDRMAISRFMTDEAFSKGIEFNHEFRIIRKNDTETRWVHGLGKIGYNEDQRVISLVGTIQDITDRKKYELELERMNRTLSALNKSSHVMALSVEENEYLKQVCNIVVNDCGFKMVWIGFAEKDEAKTVRPVASAGFNDNYLNTIRLSWGDNEYGHGPTGTAIRTGEISYRKNMLTDLAFEPWREQAFKRGYASSIGFPLKTDKQAFGAITIYSSESDPFNKDQIDLLSKLANDLVHGITTIRLRAAHHKAEIALRKSHENLEELVKLRTRELEITNEHLSNEIKIRVEQEYHLVVAEEKYRTVADFTYNMETWIDTNGNYIYVSPSCEKVTGYTAYDFINDPKLMVNITHPDDMELVKEHFEEKVKGHLHNCNLDFRIITKEGKERWIGHSCQTVYNEKGEWIGQRGSNRNINKQKESEKVLIESEKHLRALAHRMDSIAEEERIRIAREIHDEIGHLLTALKYDTEGLINHSEFSQEHITEELTGMVSMIESLIDSVRKIATELRPGILDHMGLLAAIEWKIKQFRLKSRICCEYKIEEMDVEFTKNETTFIYRILQEIFTNTTRHAQATHMWISITKKDDLFIMKVRDNGVGFDVPLSLQKGSLGMMGMRERAMSIGGEIQIESAPGIGTTTTFLLKKIDLNDKNISL